MQQPPVIIAPQRLSAEALKAVIERFVLREGTDYGKQEIELSRKIDAVRRQIDSGKALIVFDPATESITILAANDPALKTLLPAKKD
jgi:uncharacterized protein YheU (UPF0270 family)